MECECIAAELDLQIEANANDPRYIAGTEMPAMRLIGCDTSEVSQFRYLRRTKRVCKRRVGWEDVPKFYTALERNLTLEICGNRANLILITLGLRAGEISLNWWKASYLVSDIRMKT